MFWDMLILITSFFGGALGTFGLLKFFPTLLTNLISEVHQQKNRVLLENIRNGHQTQLESLRNDFNVKLEDVRLNSQKMVEDHKNHLQDVARYSEYQFKLYNELWASLYDLKYEADKLWKRASVIHMKSFAKQLFETKKKVGQNILLIRDDHYRALLDIINAFEEFRIGKDDLISIQNRRTNVSMVDRDVVNIIEANEEIKNQYSVLLDRLAGDFKNHVSRSMSSKEEQLEFLYENNFDERGSLLQSSP
jgi:hypothetical protein